MYEDVVKELRNLLCAYKATGNGNCHQAKIFANAADAIEDMTVTLAEAHKTSKNVATEYDDCDQFVCSECGIELQDWRRVERDEDDGDVTYYEYRFRFCPNCGAKIGGT